MRYLYIVLLTIISYLAHSQATYEVSPVYSNSNYQYSTILNAYNVASDGDTIKVKAGTYSNSLTIAKNIYFVGVDSSTCIISGVVTINNGASKNSKPITFYGLKFINNNVTVNNLYGGTFVFKRCLFSNNTLYINQQNYVGHTVSYITENYFSNTQNETCVYSNGSIDYGEVICEGNVIDHPNVSSSSYGIRARTGWKVINNTVRGCYRGIYVYESNISVIGNTIYDCTGDAGIYISNPYNSMIAGNHIYNCKDGVRIFISNQTPLRRFDIKNNLFRGCTQRHINIDFDYSYSEMNMYIFNNVFYGNTADDNIYFNRNGEGVKEIKYNIFQDNSGAGKYPVRINYNLDRGNVTTSYNCFYNNTNDTVYQPIIISNNITTTPDFVNAGGSYDTPTDFTLGGSTTCANAGDNTDSLFFNIDKTVADFGIYGGQGFDMLNVSAGKPFVYELILTNNKLSVGQRTEITTKAISK